MKAHLAIGILFLMSSLSTEACLLKFKKKKEVNIPEFCGKFTNESSLPTADLSVVVHYISYDEKTEIKQVKAKVDDNGRYCLPAQLFKTAQGVLTSLDVLHQEEVLSVEGFRWQLSMRPISRLHPYVISTENNKRDAAQALRAYSHLILREFKEDQQVLNIRSIYDNQFSMLAKGAQKRAYPGETEEIAWAIEISNTITVQGTYWLKPTFTFKTLLDQNPAERCGELFPYPDTAPERLMSSCIASSATEFKNDNEFSGKMFSSKRGKTLLLSTDLTEDLLKTAVRDTSASIVFYRNGKIDQRVPMKFYLAEDFPENCVYTTTYDGKQILGVRCNGALTELLDEQNYVLGIQ